MMMLLFYSCVLTLLVGAGHCNAPDDGRLAKVLHALTRALHYLHEERDEINLDAVFAVRQVQEQLQAYLTYDVLEFRTLQHWLEVLRDKAKRIADEGRYNVRKKNIRYAAKIGYWMDDSPRYVWHPSRSTSEQFVETRVQCSSPYDQLDGTLSDICFSQIGANKTNLCSMSPECLEMESKPYQRDYVISHQMLYWRMMEINECVDEVPEKLQQRFCSNMMRDAQLIAAANYPESHQDLFLEQIALCGMWGFSDFHKPDWTDRILDWQEESGCYSGKNVYYCTDDLQSDPPSRVKRREKTLSDNCLAHRTAAGILALVMNLRFEAEKAYQGMDESQNGLNKQLI